MGGTLVAAPAQAATPPVKIHFIYYDSPGADTRSNTSLNAEYIQLRNTTSKARSLTGWTVRDKTGYTYRFPTFTLAAGAKVTIRTGKGSATRSTRYYNRSSYVWNNTGDTAYLRNASGTLMHSCSYVDTSTTVSKYC